VIINRRSRTIFVGTLLLPSILLVGAFVIYPLLNGLRLSFTNSSPIRPNERWVGLRNYERLLVDSAFWEVVFNSILIVGTAIVAALVIGFVFALMLNTGLRGTGFFRSAVFQVWIVPWITVTILWGWLFSADYGIVNYTLVSLGVIDRPANWLATPSLAQLVVILGFAWRTVPFMMVTSLAALQGIPEELLEAAAIDGASYFKRLLFVMIPLVRNVLLTVGLLQAVRMFQEITLLWVLTQGGPVNATTTLSLFTYKLAFQRWEFGIASAVGALWLLMLTIFALFYLRLFVQPEE
jgi:multiple sugar transport system permease protein